MKTKTSILELGPDFYDVVQSALFPQKQLRYRNQEAAKHIGLDGLNDSDWLKHFADFEAFTGSLNQPLALRYHGHQFGTYNPDLGDGRGFLFAQFEDQQGRLLDLGTKGSGQTPYSRRGDGRLTLKGAVREALATEYLETLQVHTSRTLSVVETGESLTRYDEPSPTRSAVLVRLSHSHIRFGTFQRLAFLKQNENVIKLLEYCCRHLYPELNSFSLNEKIMGFLQLVAEAQARLVAQWMIAGFVHGVLNTDNLSITGESFDYGPYRFLPTFDPHFVAAYFDQSGLYAFGNQPQVVFWSLHELAKGFTSWVPLQESSQVLNTFMHSLEPEVVRLFILRCGLLPFGDSRDQNLFDLGFRFLRQSQCGYSQFFHDGSRSLWQTPHSPNFKHYQGEQFFSFLKRAQEFPLMDPQTKTYPVPDRDRAEDLLIDEIESIWSAISENDDWQPFSQKIKNLQHLRRHTHSRAQ